MQTTPSLSASLHWVQGELAQSLQRVRSLIEQRIEAPEDPLPLKQAVVELHQVRGTSSMIQCAGIAGLAEEMKMAVQDVLNGAAPENEGLYAALMGAAVQLADYVDALVTGMQDSVLVFQPTISELRVARGKPPAGDCDVWASQPGLASLAVHRPSDPASLPPDAAQAAAQKFLGVFQQNLVLWLKNQDVQLALGRIGKVSEQVAAASRATPVYQLWRMSAALAEALLTRGLDDTPELKRVLGRAGSQLKLLAEQGEDAASKAVGNLPFQILFFVGRSRSQGPRVAALKNAYGLARLVPSAADVEALRAKIRGPNSDLLMRLSEEIRKDLAQVKDQIDLAVRGAGKTSTDFKPTIDKLNRVGVTLSMLGLGALQEVVQAQARALAGLKLDVGAAAHPAWLELATALLRVEHSLDDALSRQLRRARAEPGVAAPPDGLTGGIPAVDVQEGREALMRESLVDLAKLKTAADAYLKDGFREQLEEARRMLAQIEPGLQILGSEHAAGHVANLRRHMQDPAFERVRSDRAYAEKFADVIAAIEYYFEGLRRQAPDTDARVDRIAEYLGLLGAMPATETGGPDTPPSRAPAPAVASAPASAPVPAPAPVPDEVDPEIREIFVAEAGEVLEQMQPQFEALARNISDEAAWREIRRGFHTLKGSGRMVGAKTIGEFAWEVENLLNKCLEGAVERTPAVLDLAKDAAALTPALVANFSEGQPEGPEAAALADRARRLARGEAAEGASLMATFASDAHQRLGLVQRWIRKQDLAQTHFVLDRDVTAAFHTLRGAAALVHADSVALVTGLIEDYLARLAAARAPLTSSGLKLLSDASTEIDQWIGKLEAGEPLNIDAAAWRERVASLEVARPASAATAGPSTGHVYAMAAFDRLTAIEKAVLDWERQPDDAVAAASVRTSFEELAAAAHEAGCEPQARAAAALAKLEPPTGEADTGFFGDLRDVIGSLYSQLDDFRDGTLEPADDTVLDAVAALGTAPVGEVLEVPPVAEVGEPEEEVLEVPPVEEVPEAMDEEVLEVPPVAEPEDGEPLAEEVLEIPPVAEPEAPAVPPPPPVAVDTPADPELLGIFQAEAEELLDSMNQHIRALERDPAGRDALQGLARDLHTFKGGARMAGLMGMGTAAHEMETRVERLSDGRSQTGASAISQLRTQWEGLQLLHDRLMRGIVPAVPEPVDLPPEEFPDLDDADEAAPVAAPAREPEPVSTASRDALVAAGWDPSLFWVPEDLREDQAARREVARVPVERLDQMLNEAGEISIYRSRIEQQFTGMGYQLAELRQTLSRIRDQLRALDIETDAQIAARGFSQSVDEDHSRYSGFDPLEMDRYTRMQELSRALSESLSDLSALHGTMDEELSETETLLMQQGRVNAEVQRGLMGTLMVPFARQQARLQRVVSQTAQEAGKRAELKFDGIEQELDRNVLERMVAPLEHLLRNAVVHGLEAPAERTDAGKPATGMIQVSLRREGAQLAIVVQDDGRGLNYEAIRRTAIERGLMAKEAKLRESEVAMFIFEAGFSTAKELTQSAGRGVGMDVVASEVKQLGGSLELSSEPGKGTRLVIRLPLTLAMAQVLLVRVGSETYAIPLPTLEGIARVPRDQLDDYLGEGGARFNYAGADYAVRRLGDLVDSPPHDMPEDARTVPAVLIRLGEGLAGSERRVAVLVDALLGNREIVSKAVGPQVSSVQGVAGATILPDGRVVLILDVPALLVNRARRAAVVEAAQQPALPEAPVDERLTIMVVDDSITIRRVTERLLDRNGYRVTTAKDGLDAMAQLQTESPAAILLDIEMPRADGFEVAAFVRNNPRIQNVPIIMITSRSGEKHRERARQIGVNRYVIKPYQEEQLMTELRAVLPGAGT